MDNNSQEDRDYLEYMYKMYSMTPSYIPSTTQPIKVVVRSSWDGLEALPDDWLDTGLFIKSLGGDNNGL